MGTHVSICPALFTKVKTRVSKLEVSLARRVLPVTDFVTLLAAPLTAVTAFWKDCELGPYHFLGLLASWFMTWRCRRWEGVIPVTGSVAEGKAVLFALAVAKSRPREAVSVTEPEAGTLALLPKPRLLKVGGGGGGSPRPLAPSPWPAWQLLCGDWPTKNMRENPGRLLPTWFPKYSDY